MKKIPVIIAVISAFFCFCNDSNNPYDPDNPDYVKPFYTINTSLTTVLPDNITSADTALIVLIGNLEKNQFRWCFDGNQWTEWELCGTKGCYIRLTSLDTGTHSLSIQTCYSTDGDITDSSYSFYKITYLYTVSYDPNTASSGDVPVDDGKYKQGAIVTVKGNTGNLAKTGYAFSGWNTFVDGNGKTYSPDDTFTMDTLNVTLYAKWTANNNTITFDANGGSGTMPTQTIATDAAANLIANAFTRAGHSFAGWATTATGAVEYADQANYTMGTSNVTLYAKWNANNYTITFVKNDATATGTMAQQTIACNASTNLLACGFSKAGYTFAGWATTATGPVEYADLASYTMGTENVTLYAKWSANNNTITFDANGGSGTMPTQTIATDATAKLTTNAFIRAGYSFAGWATTDTGSVVYLEQASYTMGINNVTLYAKWNANNNTITFDANGGAGTMPAQTIATGATAKLTANAFTRAGHSFAGWATTAIGDVVYADQADYTMGTSGVTLYAKWNANNYTITFVKNDATATGTMAQQTIACNASTNLLACGFSKAGYTFAGWATTATGPVEYADLASYTMGTENVTLYAKWSANNNTITFDANGGSGTMPTQTIATDATAKLTTNAFIRAGYTFTGWATTATDPVEYADQANYTMGTTNVTLYAKWTANNNKITFVANGGTGTMPTQTIATDSTVKLIVNTFIRTGHTFAGWATTTTGAVEYADQADYTMGPSNVILYAKWTANTYTVTFDPNGGTTPDPATKNVTFGSAYGTLATTTKTGFVLDGWWTVAGGTGTEITASSVVNTADDHTLYAKWSEEYTVTFDAQGATTQPVPASKTVIPPDNTIKTFPTLPAKTGYCFDGWYTGTNGSGTEFLPNTVVTASITVYAKWVPPVVYNGDTYNTIRIGSQTWMVENLKTTKYNDGTDIPLETDSATWANLATPGYCWYNNDIANKEKYGALYNWYVVNPANSKKIAPTGWSVPSDNDWTILENYLVANGYNWDGTTTGNKIAKAMAAKTDWVTNSNSGAIGNDLSLNNRSGFSALPGGVRDQSFGADFNHFTLRGNWWSTTEYNVTISWYINLDNESGDLYRGNYYDKHSGFSVRLVRDQMTIYLFDFFIIFLAKRVERFLKML